MPNESLEKNQTNRKIESSAVAKSGMVKILNKMRSFEEVVMWIVFLVLFCPI